MINNILIIDDSSESRALLKEILLGRKIAKNVIEAENGLQGLRKAKNQKFDLIIADNRMPKYSGIDLSIDLVNFKDYEPNEILIISGYLSKEEVERLLSVKIKNILSKPFSFNRLINQINITQCYQQEAVCI